MQVEIQTLLSSLEFFQEEDVFPRDAIHPFATSTPKACTSLQELLNVTEQVSHSLQAYGSSTQWSNAKLTSLLRQHTSIEHTSYSSARNVRHLIDSLSKRPDVLYGENVPLLEASFPQWCIEQLAIWGKAIGMETFTENKEGGYTVMLAGKVLLIDVDFSIKHENPFKPIITVAGVKTSNALLAGSPNTITFTMLDTFLTDSIEKYCVEMQKSETTRNTLYAATLRRSVLNNLRYLVLLDRLASRNDGGVRWFTDMDELCPTLFSVATTEAEAISASLSMPKAPLDIFLIRSHSLPLPYLTMPSISFLTYLSPAAYLSLIRKASNQPDPLNYPPLDVSLSDIKSHLDVFGKGVTIATLYLEQLSDAHLYSQSILMLDMTIRPTFPLSPTSVQLDHAFSQENSQASGPYSWVLDFTERGKRPGVVMSQSRLRAIELVVNPMRGSDGINNVNVMLSFGTGSWIDILLNTGTHVSPERYTASFKSPNNLHPPLQLRLTAPEEPGFILERILVVREQCWLNEVLLGCHWMPEGLKSEEEDVVDSSTATEEELEAVLSGTNMPHKIPVNVFLPTGMPATDNLFGPAELSFAPVSGPKILMTSPGRLPISGLVEITVAQDETKPRGVSVEVQGAMGSDIKISDLEEVCRRGGTLGLSGRVWASSHGMSS
uniref:Mediator complex subunit 1 n=1 Tax=Psilocybe cubensis TaxID=181762 RepID=A0A8H7Y857_PSICU